MNASSVLELAEPPVAPALPRPVWWLGLDVAKLTFEAALHGPLVAAPPDLSKLRVRRFARTAAGVAELFEWAEGELPSLPSDEPAPLARVVMESTGAYSTELAILILRHRAQAAPAIVNPAQITAHARSLGLRNKTDRVDARAIARYGAERSPAPWEEPTPRFRELRELVRARADMIVQLHAAHLQRDQQIASKLVRRLRSKLVKELEKAIAELDKALDELIAKHPDWAADFKLVDSIPGAGRVTFFTVLAELGDLRRFERSRQLGAFAGLSPRQKNSGTSVRGRSKICKHGSPEIRRVLFMAAYSAARAPGSPMAAFNERLLAAGKSKMAARLAVARKVLILMRAVLVSGQPYDPGFKAGRAAALCEQTPNACEQMASTC